MKTMAEKAGFNTENLTNHSARKRMIQKLNDHQVPPTHIMQTSGHETFRASTITAHFRKNSRGIYPTS